jgi:hypothetical protein
MVDIRIKAAFGPHQKEAEIQSSPTKLAANDRWQLLNCLGE